MGVYETSLNGETERLELKLDGTYVQEFHSLRHTGKWHLENEFLDGSAVVLPDAAVFLSLSDQIDHKPPPQRLSDVPLGELRLYTHHRDGKTALALNEVADWYYERVQ